MVAASCGSNEPLASYVPKSPQEHALKKVLLDFEGGANTKDVGRVGNLIHENAALMIGRERAIISKQEYINALPDRLAANPAIALSIPKIKISGDTAQVRIYMARGSTKSLVVFDMKLENSTWFIRGWKY